MNPKLIVVLIGLATFSSVCSEDGDASQSRATQVTERAMNSVKHVANKGAEKVEKAANGITVKVERFVNPEPHQPGSSNILVSAGRGIGRLMRNVTLETARAIGAVGKGTVNLVKHTGGATKETIKQAADRIARGKRSEPKVESKGKSNGQNAERVNPDSANEGNGQAPDELTKSE